MTQYAWYLTQIPVIIAHLRDSMLPLAATQYDRTRVDGTRDQPLPLRVDAMEDADQLWAALVDYGRHIAASIQPAPHALTQRLTASTQWHDAGDAAHTISAWLIYNEQHIADAPPYIGDTDLVLFDAIRRLLAKHRITPARLRTSPTRCVVCGEHAVRAEWAWNRAGELAETVQCTVCEQRYETNMLPTRAAVLALAEWRVGASNLGE